MTQITSSNAIDMKHVVELHPSYCCIQNISNTKLHLPSTFFKKKSLMCTTETTYTIHFQMTLSIRYKSVTLRADRAAAVERLNDNNIKKKNR